MGSLTSSPKMPAPQQPNYQAQANAQMSIERERARLEEEARQRELARLAEEEQRKLGMFNTNVGNAEQVARQSAIDAIMGRGLDPNTFTNDINNRLNTIRASVPYLDPNPGSYYANANIADLVLGQATDTARRNYGNAFNEFAPTGFADTRVASTLDDAIIQQILMEQYNPALEQVQRAYERGTLNDTGYNTAQELLGQQRTTAEAQLQNTGGTILSAMRDRLSGIANEGRTAASQYELGTTFDPNVYKTRLDTAYNEGVSGLEGNLRNQIGGTQYFDIGSILSRGATSQGVTNPQRELFDTFQAREQDRNKQRGLGTQGVF